MPEETAPEKVDTAPEVEVAGAGAGSLKKVELDLDDAPFLKKDEPPAEIPEDELTDLAAAVDDDAGKKKKRLMIIGAAAAVALLLAAAAAWFFFRSAPPEAPPPGPEVVVVPTPKPAEQPAEYIKEFAPFIVPRHMHAEGSPANPAKGSIPVGDDTRFLVCKFSILATDPNVSREIDEHMMPLRDAVYYYLRSKSSRFLTDAHNGAEIKTDLTGVVNDYLTQGKIEDILFESYLNK